MGKWRERGAAVRETGVRPGRCPAGMTALSGTGVGEIPYPGLEVHVVFCSELPGAVCAAAGNSTASLGIYSERGV